MERHRPTRRPAAALGAAALGLVLLGGCGGASSSLAPASAPACSAPSWIGAWRADPSDALNPGLVDQTSRTILTPHIGADALRVRLSNRLGSGPITFAKATVGLRRGSAGAALVPGSARPVTFAGAGSVTIPAGGEAVSDPIALHLLPSADVAVSLFAAGATGPATEHVYGQQTSFFSAPGSGDRTGDPGGAAFVLPTKARYFVSGVDIQAPGAVGDVVALGDSTTDGFGGPTDGDDRYPDILARRLDARVGHNLTALNAGISGNRVLADGHALGAGPSALARLDSDVLGVPGVSDVIVLEGINDIGTGSAAGPVIAGLGQIVARLHAAGLGVQLGTLTPFRAAGAAGSAAIAGEAVRVAVNRWIRGGGGGADGIIDFEAAVRDPADPTRLDPRYDSGDHIHPNAAGRRAMAAAVDLAGLRRVHCRAG